MKLVIDQNQLRKPPLEKFLAASKENYAVLTDTAIFEMLKGNAPIYVADKSLKILSRFPDQLLATDGTGVLMRKELAERKAIATPVNDLLTDRLRIFLSKAHAYYDGHEKVFPIDKAVFEQMTKIKRQRLNHGLHKKALLDGIDAIKKSSLELQAKMKERIFDRDVYRFAYQAAFTLFSRSISRFGLSNEVIQRLYLDYCLWARISMISFLFVMEWYVKNGAVNMGNEKTTNQFIDNDYIVSATYFDGILSEEKEVNMLYGKMRDLLEANYVNYALC